MRYIRSIVQWFKWKQLTPRQKREWLDRWGA